MERFATLPDWVRECCARWGVTPGAPFPGSTVSVVMPVSGSDGLDAVLKLQFPHRESEHEAAALRAWAGDGAVQLLDEAPDLHALLLERCRPGTHLSVGAEPEEALDVCIELVARLAIPAGGPFTSLADEAGRWARGLRSQWARAGRPFAETLVDRAIDRLVALAATQGEPVLVHQDLHGENVLCATRQPWLAIDPKPLVGEREFAAAPVIRSSELGHSRAAVVRRLDRLAEGLHLDRDRTRDWAFAQTIAWAFEGDTVLDRHVETARWLLEA